MISFVFYACAHRLDNLTQTLRLLNVLEPNLPDKEIIVVFQDEGPELEGVKTVNLGLSSYHKPLQCNVGVKMAFYPIVALLDSDRILPKDYFHNALRVFKQKQFVTVKDLRTCIRPESDDVLLSGEYEFWTESRSTTNEFRLKNLFSGNTVFFKDDYLAIGGMDERYIGYGYADNDMTQTVLYHGMKAIYLNGFETHLYHPRSVNYQGKVLNDIQIQSAINIMKYCRKWRYFDDKVLLVCESVMKKISLYPSDLQDTFLFWYKRTFTI